MHSFVDFIAEFDKSAATLERGAKGFTRAF